MKTIFCLLDEESGNSLGASGTRRGRRRVWLVGVPSRRLCSLRSNSKSIIVSYRSFSFLVNKMKIVSLFDDDGWVRLQLNYSDTDVLAKHDEKKMVFKTNMVKTTAI